MVKKKDALAPGSVIGILGGGQLGRMAALAAARLGYRSHIYCPDADSPASQVTSLSTVAAYEDEAALTGFAEAVDVVTFEFENVPAKTAEILARHKPVRPGPKVLHICQNRLREKDFCAANKIATTRYAEVSSADNLARTLREFTKPAVLKTTEFGYDGKGQVLIQNDKDPAQAWEEMSGGKKGVQGILEGYVDFDLEISVIVARTPDGGMQSYPPVENQHRNHILDQTIAPARISPQVAERAEMIAKRLTEAMEVVGLLAIEMFVTTKGEVLVNEMAPRPHNSGHWTMDACVTSQFEQFVRAVAGLPLGSVERSANAVMKNLIGDDVKQWHTILQDPAARLHLYGKAEARPGRKMGHVNRLFPKE